MDKTPRLDSIILPPRADAVPRAQRVLTILKRRTLAIVASLALVGCGVSGGADIALNVKYYSMRFADEFGVTEDMLGIWAMSAMTLGFFFFISWLWDARWPRIAVTVYVVLLALLIFLLLPVGDQIIRESLAPLVPASFGVSAAGDVPAVLYWLFMVLLGFAFTVPGICFCLCKLVLTECWTRWEHIDEADTFLAKRSAAQAVIARRNGLLELLKLDVAKLGDGWANEGLMDYRRGLERRCVELAAISNAGASSDDARQKAYAELTQLRIVINSLTNA